MADEKRFTLRLPSDLAEALEHLAKCNERSLHAQIIYLLRQAVRRKDDHA